MVLKRKNGDLKLIVTSSGILGLLSVILCFILAPLIRMEIDDLRREFDVEMTNFKVRMIF